MMTPTNVSARDYPKIGIKIRAFDGFNASEQTFDLTISETDVLPEPNVYIAEGLKMEFEISKEAFVFEVGTQLSYTAQITPQRDWLTFDPETLKFSGLPVGNGVTGTYNVAITATPVTSRRRLQSEDPQTINFDFRVQEN